MDPRWKLVTERVDDVLKIKWCNGFGDKVKLDPLGDLLGTNPMTKDGKFIPAGTGPLMVISMDLSLGNHEKIETIGS